MTIKIYGIKNCDTVKKTLSFLREKNLEYQFYDYKKEGVDLGKLREFVAEFGWENIINRRGTTWRKLGDEQSEIIDDESALKLMCMQSSIIKRPLVEVGLRKIVGFDELKRLFS